jgi:hypothetical protein
MEELTDKRIKESSPAAKPIVGVDRDLMDLILHVAKGFYVIEAHTGAGKTTFGLTLYHMSRVNEIQERVTYINLRLLWDKAGVNDENRFIDELERIIAKPVSGRGRYGYEVVYTTVERDFESEGLRELLDELSGVRKRYIVVLDELERIRLGAVSIQRLIGWARTLREYYDIKNLIPLKVLLLVPKAIEYRGYVDNIRRLGDHVWVFTEVRSLNVNTNILRDYLKALGEHFRSLGFSGSIVGDVIDERSLETLINYLVYLESGRYAFSILRKAIADCITKYLNGKNIDNEKSLISELNNALTSRKPPVEVEVGKYTDPKVKSLIDGRFYGIDVSKREAINTWVRGLGRVLEMQYQNISLISRELNFIIYQLNPTIFAWLTFKKPLTINDYKKAAKKIANIISGISGRGEGRERRPPPLIKVLVLKPFTATGYYEPEMTYQGLRFQFIPKDLELQEIISMMVLGSTRATVGVDPNLAEIIARELASRLRA